MQATDERPGIEEQYSQATQSSNLRCDTRDGAPLGDVAPLIAMGWSPSRVGAALMRLHTKADRLTLEHVQQQLTWHAQALGVERPSAAATSVLAWWLDSTCKPCEGRKFEHIAGTPSLSTRHCKACRGSGKAHLAYGEAGKDLAHWMKNCVEHSLSSVKKRLRPNK